MPISPLIRLTSSSISTLALKQSLLTSCTIRKFAWWPFKKSTSSSSVSSSSSPSSASSLPQTQSTHESTTEQIQFPYVQDQFEDTQIYRSSRELPQPTPEQLAEMDYIDPEIYNELKKFYIEETGSYHKLLLYFTYPYSQITFTMIYFLCVFVLWRYFIWSSIFLK
jgi:hypothetical protein